MDIQRLVAMANQIGEYFDSDPDKAEVVKATANHLRKYWEPRMRKAIIAHYRGKGEGLSGVAGAAVGQLAAQSDQDAAAGAVVETAPAGRPGGGVTPSAGPESR